MDFFAAAATMTGSLTRFSSHWLTLQPAGR
jgi:hypothetical protein